MAMDFRSAQRNDLPLLLQLWNALYIHDQVDERRFGYVMFDDPHVQSGGTVVAMKNNKIVGFASSTVIESVGYLKALAFDEQNVDIADTLLNRAESFIGAHGSKTVTVVHYPDDYYFFPGIDKRYKHLLHFFQQQQYGEKEEAHDMTIDLKNFAFTKQQRQKLEQVSQAGIDISEYEKSMKEALQDFRAAIDQPTWFNELESDAPSGQNALAALNDDVIIGLCEYQVREGIGDFGPLHVRLDEREKGIGSALLLEAMLRMQKMGAEESTAKWVWPFRLYESTGWSILRSYSILEKNL